VKLEDQKMIESLKSSWRITQGNWWRALGLFLALYLFGFFATIFQTTLLGISGMIFVFIVNVIMSSWSAASFVQAFMQLKGPNNDCFYDQTELYNQ